MHGVGFILPFSFLYEQAREPGVGSKGWGWDVDLEGASIHGWLSPLCVHVETKHMLHGRREKRGGKI